MTTLTTPRSTASPLATELAVPLIELSSLSKSYGKVQAVSDVSLALRRGEFAAITGPSGSGKSTLLGIIGLLEAPTSGDYLFRGKHVQAMTDTHAAQLRNQAFGFVFQEFHLLPELSAWENVARPLVYAGVAKPERRQRALDLLETFGLADRAGHRPAQLSGGEQQRVAIARALVNDPEVVLADEPTGNLPEEQWQPVLQALGDLAASGKTVVVVTHEPAVAAAAERNIVLRSGSVVGS